MYTVNGWECYFLWNLVLHTIWMTPMDNVKKVTWHFLVTATNFTWIEEIVHKSLSSQHHYSPSVPLQPCFHVCSGCHISLLKQIGWSGKWNIVSYLYTVYLYILELFYNIFCADLHRWYCFHCHMVKVITFYHTVISKSRIAELIFVIGIHSYCFIFLL